MERLPSVPVQSRAADPDWVPSQLARACSEGGDANQGRCKCGEGTPLTATLLGALAWGVCRAWESLQYFQGFVGGYLT